MTVRTNANACLGNQTYFSTKHLFSIIVFTSATLLHSAVFAVVQCLSVKRRYCVQRLNLF